MSEQTYTLDEAKREMQRQECAAGRHRPAVEFGNAASLASQWLCECGRFMYKPEVQA